MSDELICVACKSTLPPLPVICPQGGYCAPGETMGSRRNDVDRLQLVLLAAGCILVAFAIGLHLVAGAR